MMVKRLFVLLCVLCCIAVFTVPSQSVPNGTQRVTGTFYPMSGRAAGRSRPFTLIVNSYTAPNQVRELNEALGRGGQDELLRAMSKMEAGRIQFGTGVGVTANAIIADSWGDGGTKLTVLYERWVRFFELRYGSRSQDYPVGYAELFLDRNGKGEGTMIPAARVRLKGENTWEVEDFGVFPARLLGLRTSGRVVPR